MAKVYNLYIDQGTDWSANLTAHTSNGTATLNLGDYYSSVSQIRKEFSTPDSSATITSNIHISNSAGLLYLTMNNVITSALTAGRYLYDIELTRNDNKIFRIYQGIVTVRPRVTQ